MTAEAWSESHRRAVNDTPNGSSGGASDTPHGDVQAEQVIDVTVQRTDPQVAVVRVTGDVDMLTTPVLRSTVEQQIAVGCRKLVIDMRDVTFLGSSGLAALVEAQRASEARGVALRLVGDSRAVTRPLVATGLREVFELHADLESASA